MIFLFKISRPGLEPTQLPGQWVSRDVAMGIEWPGCEVDFTISSAKVKNEWSCTSTTPPFPQYAFMAWAVTAVYIMPQKKKIQNTVS